jgi:hypothetical protein
MAYNIEHVKVLLEKYWAAESTLDEEQLLRDYFQQNTIDPNLEKYRAMFGYFVVQQSVAMKGNVASNARSIPKVVELKTKKQKGIWLKIAAAALLLLSSYAVYNKVTTKPEKAFVWVDTYDTEEEALEKTKEVLLLVSRKMKKGTDKAAQSLQKAQVATGVVNLSGHTQED